MQTIFEILVAIGGLFLLYKVVTNRIAASILASIIVLDVFFSLWRFLHITSYNRFMGNRLMSWIVGIVVLIALSASFYLLLGAYYG